MSVGLLAVVDDIQSAAMKASAKAAGVVIDDAAVTPQYVQGLTPAQGAACRGQDRPRIAREQVPDHHPGRPAAHRVRTLVLPYLLILGGGVPLLRGCREGAGVGFGVQHGHADEGARDEKKLVLVRCAPT